MRIVRIVAIQDLSKDQRKALGISLVESDLNVDVVDGSGGKRNKQHGKADLYVDSQGNRLEMHCWFENRIKLVRQWHLVTDYQMDAEALKAMKESGTSTLLRGTYTSLL